MHTRVLTCRKNELTPTRYYEEVADEKLHSGGGDAGGVIGDAVEDRGLASARRLTGTEGCRLPNH